MVAILQGFPGNWVFSGTKTAAYRQVGNAFPPPVAQAVGTAIRKAITSVDLGPAFGCDDTSAETQDGLSA
jgi:DNA (cytosine-5)-methyltransferase 1